MKMIIKKIKQPIQVVLIAATLVLLPKLNTNIVNTDGQYACSANILDTALNWAVPQATAAELISDDKPGFRFDDTDETGFQWYLRADQNTFQVYNYNTFSNIFTIDNRTEMEFIMLETATNLRGSYSQNIIDVGHTAPARSLQIKNNGDVSIVDGDVFIDRTSNHVGIGTTIPQQHIHIDSGSNPTMRLDAGFDVFDLGVYAGDFNIELVAGGQTGKSFTIEDHNGYIGIWEENPDAVLDIKSPDGIAQIRVEDTAGANNTVGTTINNINNGPASMRFHDTYNNETLIFRTTQSGGISFDNPDTVGELEFAVEKGGRAKFTGDVLVDGVVVHASSRELKENFKLVKAKKVLDKVNALEIAEWNYIDTDDQIKHIGPVAEEFYEAFKLGETRKGISSVDSAGVALLAIQGLSQQLDDKQAKIENMEARINELEYMVRTTLVALNAQQSLNSNMLAQGINQH